MLFYTAKIPSMVFDLSFKCCKAFLDFSFFKIALPSAEPEPDNLEFQITVLAPLQAALISQKTFFSPNITT